MLKRDMMLAGVLKFCEFEEREASDCALESGWDVELATDMICGGVG